MISVQEENEKMIEVVMKVDEEFWDNITQLTVFKEQKEMIHCKDCKYSTEPDAYGLRVCRRMCGLSGFTDYDFCSKGEKR